MLSLRLALTFHRSTNGHSIPPIEQNDRSHNKKNSLSDKPRVGLFARAAAGQRLVDLPHYFFRAVWHVVDVVVAFHLGDVFLDIFEACHEHSMREQRHSDLEIVRGVARERQKEGLGCGLQNTCP